MRAAHRWVVVFFVAGVLAGCATESDETPASSEDVTGPVVDDAPEQAGEGAGPEAFGIYAELETWMCHPALEPDVNRCHDDLDLTVVAGDGTIEVVEHVPANEPTIDCFYVYPTVSLDPEPNSDLDVGEDEEIYVLHNQAARLNEVCEVWAPIYRQRTLAALLGAIDVGDEEAVRELAYTDVVDAWNTYLAQSDPGRGVVVVGHSQGASLLNRLLGEHVDGDPAVRERLVAAYLLGSSVAVPEGEDIGGDFEHLGLCRAGDQIGCVVSYATFRATAPPPPNSLFGRPRSGEGVSACVHPGAPGGGSAPLELIVPTEQVWADGFSGPEITTPFVALPGIVEGECVETDGFSYLEVTVVADPNGPRRADIDGDLTPEWGLHLVDVNLAMGNLIDLLAAQADASIRS